jgi:predicted ester cyclase
MPVSVEEAKAHVSRYLEVLNQEVMSKGNLDAIDALIAPDHRFYAGKNPPLEGRDGWKQVAIGARTAFPDGQFTIEDLIAEGDQVAFRWTMRGTHRGEWRGIAPTGKPVTNTGLSILRLRDGMRVEERVQSDQVGVMEQIGALPIPAVATG